MNKADARKELERRRLARRKPWNPAEILLDYQFRVFADESHDRVFMGTRQIGKSLLAAVCIIAAGLLNPGSDIAYVDMDITHADKILWRELDRLITEYKVDAEIKDGELRFANGAVAYVFSGQPSEVQKLQGLKLSLLIVDEAQEAHALKKILEMIRPALMRFNGRVMLFGIPGYMKQIGQWWNVTEGDAAHMYGQHRAHYSQNTYLNEEAQKREYETAKAEQGEDSPEFTRHWKGEWPDVDSSLRVFRYFPERNGYDGDAPPTDFHSLGIDPGGVLDAEAIVVTGYAKTENRIYHVDEEFSEKKMGGDWDDTAARVGPLDEKWHCVTKFYDYGSVKKGALALIYQQDHAITVEAVPEKDPESEIRRINRLLNLDLLKIKKGSKLEADLLYTTLDPKKKAEGKFAYASSYKQNGGDALRAALWGQYAYVEIKEEKKVETDAEVEAKAVKAVWRAPVQLGGPKERYVDAAPEGWAKTPRKGPTARY